MKANTIIEQLKYKSCIQLKNIMRLIKYGMTYGKGKQLFN